MLKWDCCRTCLTTENLNPIFTSSGQNDKYVYVLFTAFGIKIEPNDNLPQQMCTECIEFVNQSKKFRKRAENALKELLKRLQNTEFDEQKTEQVKIELTIPQSELLDTNQDANDFGEYDDEDEVTLNNFQHKCKEEDEQKTKVEFPCHSEDIANKPVENVFESKLKKKNTVKAKPAKRKAKIQLNGEQKQVETKEKNTEKEVIECEYCKKRLTSKNSMRNHYKIHTGFDVVCEHCGKKFITRRLLLMHCRAKHGYEKTDKCSFCDYRASNAEQVKIHERLHTGEKPFVCSECGSGFHRKSSYLQHVATHLPEKTVQCEQCPARFKSVTLMRIHAYRHRASQYSYQCTLCAETFARRRNVTRHVRRVHAVTPSDECVKRDGVK